MTLTRTDGAFFSLYSHYNLVSQTTSRSLDFIQKNQILLFWGDEITVGRRLKELAIVLLSHPFRNFVMKWLQRFL